MTGISLVSIYFIGKHVLGRRRATFVVFAMLLYPLFIGGKSDHYNDAQALLAILPLTVWMFLLAYEKPTLSRGLMLGLAAAASMLTYYSAAFGLLGLTLAAVLLPSRRDRALARTVPFAVADCRRRL
jgi:4-amino-4-deoxy-L-arabinose transferase-like glycosyltransferase